MPKIPLNDTTQQTSWLQQWLENIWYKKGRGRFLFLPFSALYCVINAVQRLVQTHNLKALSCPIIVVGNITVGGTGKTPLTIHVVKLLQKAGYKPAIITRGYGGSARLWPQLVTSETDPFLVGDEAVLMATRTDVPVYAGANRLESIEQLLDEQDCDVIISDDGMQHYKMHRDIQIAVIDASRLLGNGYCLPAGPLREPKKRLEACDLVVLNGQSEAPKKNQNWLKMKLEGDLLVNLKSGEEKPLKSFRGITVNAVTGIGNPQRFYQTLEQGGLVLKMNSFPDHHPFAEADLRFNNKHEIIMTEKDAVKCRGFSHQRMWYLPVKAVLNTSFDKKLVTLLEAKVKN